MPLGQAHTGDFRPHHRPVGFVEIEQAQALVISGLLQVAVEEVPAQSTFIAVIEIHHQKRDVVDDIDPAQVVIELDAVEQQRLILKPGHVRQVHVTMTGTDEAIGFTLRDRRRQCRADGLRPVLQPGQLP